MFAARTLSRTCPSPGTGRSTSWSCITWLGSPSWCTCHACMRGLHGTALSDRARPHTKRSLADQGTVMCVTPSRAGRTRPHMHPLPLWPEQAQELHGPLPRRPEPVRHPRVELGGLPRTEHHIMIGQHEPQPPRHHVQPLIALVGPGFRLELALRFEHLVRLESAGLPGER